MREKFRSQREIRHFPCQALDKGLVVSLKKKLFPCYSVLVGSRNKFEHAIYAGLLSLQSSVFLSL